MNESIAEQTKIGRFGMSPAREKDLVSLLDTRRSVRDFDRLSDIDVLGVGEINLSHDQNLYKKFNQQLERNEGGWYKTGLVWTESKLPLNDNKSGSLGSLIPLLKRVVQNPETFKAYDQVIRYHLVNTVIEKVSENQSKNPKEFFIPHRPVIK